MATGLGKSALVRSAWRGSDAGVKRGCCAAAFAVSGAGQFRREKIAPKQWPWLSHQSNPQPITLMRNPGQAHKTAKMARPKVVHLSSEQPVSAISTALSPEECTAITRFLALSWRRNR